ncbi:hypothetical protein [Scytonema sp. PCC 10023]|uniref:hypothetical protein n=1 Tax=Scytonema sp. PCC 10023 TaxID=1680591 RepID=UPI0039C70CB9
MSTEAEKLVVALYQALTLAHNSRFTPPRFCLASKPPLPLARGGVGGGVKSTWNKGSNVIVDTYGLAFASTLWFLYLKTVVYKDASLPPTHIGSVVHETSTPPHPTMPATYRGKTPLALN